MKRLAARALRKGDVIVYAGVTATLAADAITTLNGYDTYESVLTVTTAGSAAHQTWVLEASIEVTLDRIEVVA